MRSALLALLLCSAPLTAQIPDAVASGYHFALPDHPGRLTFQAPGFAIEEASAKSNGHEFGLRGKAAASSTSLLAFLFLFPEAAPLNSDKCRNSMLNHETQVSTAQSISTSASGSNLALAEYTHNGYSIVRAFVAKDDLCADITFTAKHPISITTPEIQQVLHSIDFQPAASAGFPELFEYATVLFRHGQPAQAAPIYAKALTLAPAEDPNKKWHRVTTDQASMAYGMAGNLARSREINQQAIQSDPDYPLYYYNLACADAEQGDATHARVHLEQAFARRQNILPGESFPNPAQDDSIAKLKNDKPFWAFVQTLK